MNDHIDLIDALRQLDPVPPGSIDEAQCATAAQLRMSLCEGPVIVPMARFDHRRVRSGSLSWWKVAAAIAVIGPGIAAVLLWGGDDDGLRPAVRITDTVTSVSEPTSTTEPTTSPTIDDSAPGTLGASLFAMLSPSTEEEAQATDFDLYRDDFELMQVSAVGNYVSLRSCRDSKFATCGNGWAYVTGAAGGGEVHGGLLGELSPVNLHLYLLDDRYFVALESAPGEEAPATAWLIDAVSGQSGVLRWLDEPTALDSAEQMLLLCQESYNSFGTTCAVAAEWDDTPFVAEVGEVSSGGTTVTETSLFEGQYLDMRTEAGLPKVVDVRDGTIRPLAMPDNASAELPVSQQAAGRIWIGTDLDGGGLGLAFSDDGGVTWTQVTVPEQLHATSEELANVVHDDLLEIAADGDRVALARSWGGDDNAVYVSEDAGKSWTTATSEPNGNGVHLYVLADGRLVVMGSMDAYPSELLVSTRSQWAELDKLDSSDLGRPLDRDSRFSVNGAGVAMIRSYSLPCDHPCPGYTQDEAERSVPDTVAFSVDLTNWSTIQMPHP